jgi:SAM-dependent methyltransferase
MAFDRWVAENYERLWPELFDPAVLDPAVDLLAELAAGGPALEFGVGTGRLAIPLHRRGIAVHGIDVSAPMIAAMRGEIPATVGDFARVRAGDGYSLVYLVRNTITNLTTQDDQVAVFRNAAAHLAPGGRFVIENYVPELRRLPPGENTYLYTATPEHVGYEEYDLTRQIAVSHRR